MRLSNLLLAAGAFGALGAVIAGAVGAHVLAPGAQSNAIAIFETANRYQMYHSLALLLLAALAQRDDGLAGIKVAAGCFVTGMLLFCGSLYAKALFALHAPGFTAPVGGSLLMLGWLWLAIGAIRRD